MGRPKGSKNKSKSGFTPPPPSLSDEDLANLKEYHEAPHWGKISIFCAACNTEIQPGKTCKCSKEPITLANTKPYLTVNATNMSKVRFWNSVTEEWFKPVMFS